MLVGGSCTCRGDLLIAVSLEQAVSLIGWGRHPPALGLVAPGGWLLCFKDSFNSRLPAGGRSVAWSKPKQSGDRLSQQGRYLPWPPAGDVSASPFPARFLRPAIVLKGG